MAVETVVDFDHQTRSVQAADLDSLKQYETFEVNLSVVVFELEFLLRILPY